MKDLAKVPISTNPLGRLGKAIPRTCREAWGSDLPAGERKADKWVLRVVLVCAMAGLLMASCEPKPAMKRLACETAAECEALIAAEKPLWGKEKSK